MHTHTTAYPPPLMGVYCMGVRSTPWFEPPSVITPPLRFMHMANLCSGTWLEWNSEEMKL